MKEILEKLNDQVLVVDTNWVKENDLDTYEYLRDMLEEFVNDPANTSDEDDLESFENGNYLVEYIFEHDEENDTINIRIYAGRDYQDLANQPPWVDQDVNIDEFFENWPYKSFIEKLENADL